MSSSPSTYVLSVSQNSLTILRRFASICSFTTIDFTSLLLLYRLLASTEDGRCLGALGDPLLGEGKGGCGWDVSVESKDAVLTTERGL